MVARITQTITNLDIYPDIVQRRRATAAYGILALLMLVLLVNQSLVWFKLVATPAQDEVPLLSLRPLLALIAAIVAYVLIRNGLLRIAALLILGMMLVIQASSLLLVGWQYDALVVFPAMVAVIAALIAPGWMTLVVSLVSTAFLTFAIALSGELATLSSVLTLIQNLVVGLLAFILARGWQHSLTIAGTQNTQHRLRMAELSAEVTQRIFQHMDLQALLNETVEAIRERFVEIYHAQVFLIDAQGKNAAPQGQHRRRRRAADRAQARPTRWRPERDRPGHRPGPAVPGGQYRHRSHPSPQ